MEWTVPNRSTTIIGCDPASHELVKGEGIVNRTVMPRFYFHVRDSIISSDQEGTELPNLRAARDQAIETAGAMLRENPDSLWAGTPWRMEVKDEGNQLLFSLDFALQQATSEG